MSKKLIIIYYGKGEGKTSAALGHVVRACAYGKVAVIQFMKGRKTGEYETLKRLKNVEVYLLGIDKFLTEKTKEKHKKVAQRALMLAEKKLQENYFLIILDEILYTLEYRLLDENEILKLLKKRKCHVILTGRKVSKKILQISHIATEMQERKHHYEKDKETIRGVEF